MTRTHDLKCWPEPFQAILDGRKTFEVRDDDRGYAVNDVLMLREFEPSGAIGHYTDYDARCIRLRVTYILHGGRFGLPAHICVMGIEREARADKSGDAASAAVPTGDLLVRGSGAASPLLDPLRGLVAIYEMRARYPDERVRTDMVYAELCDALRDGERAAAPAAPEKEDKP